MDYERKQDSGNAQCYQDLEKVDGDIILKNVTFRYGNRKPVLNNISFTIPMGKKWHWWEPVEVWILLRRILSLI